MPILRKAQDEPKRIPLDEEGSYVEVASEITKGEFRELVKVLPSDLSDNAEDLQLDTAMQLTEDFFRILVKGWSLDVAPTVEAYNALPNEAANAIDTALMAHFNSLTVGASDRKKPRK